MIDFSEIQRKITSDFSIGELEERLKPKEGEWKEGRWSDYSHGGFLAPNERFIEVVKADYDTLRVLGKSYEDMAQLANNFLKQLEMGSYIREKFTFMQLASCGFQSCPWECKKDEKGYSTSGSSHVYVMRKGEEDLDLMKKYLKIERESSDREFPNLSFDEAEEARRKVLRELERGIGIEFGGMDRALYLSAFTVVTDLTPHLIASHYFFQGNASFRTDPSKLLQVAEIE